MSLRSQAYADFASILEADGDDVTLIAQDATEYEVKAQVIRRDAQVDPQTNAQITEPVLAVSIALSGLAAVPDPDTWTLATTDATGTALTRRIVDVRVDRTIGIVTMICEEFDDG